MSRSLVSRMTEVLCTQYTDPRPAGVVGWAAVATCLGAFDVPNGILSGVPTGRAVFKAVCPVFGRSGLTATGGPVCEIGAAPCDPIALPGVPNTLFGGLEPDPATGPIALPAVLGTSVGGLGRIPVGAVELPAKSGTDRGGRITDLSLLGSIFTLGPLADEVNLPLPRRVSRDATEPRRLMMLPPARMSRGATKLGLLVNLALPRRMSRDESDMGLIQPGP